jgi:hypothetical protein
LMESAGAIANTSSSRKRNIAKVLNIGKVRESPRKRRRTADPEEESSFLMNNSHNRKSI